MNTQIQSNPIITTNTQISGLNRQGLSRIGGACALMIGVLLLVEMISYFVSSAPSMADPATWFTLFQNNRFIGLIDFGLLELYALLLFIPTFLALYAALKRAGENYMAIAAILAFVGIAANFATCKLFPMLTLSDLYAAAPTDILKSQFLAAGQAVLAQGALGGIGGGVEGGIPLAISGLIISIVMLRSNIMGRAAGIVGILANGMGLAMYIRAAGPPSWEGSPFFGAFFMFSIVWYVLVAVKLFRYKSDDQTAAGL